MLKSQWRTTDRKEAAICKYSTKLVFLKISQNSLENGYVEVSLRKTGFMQDLKNLENSLNLPKVMKNLENSLNLRKVMKSLE